MSSKKLLIGIAVAVVFVVGGGYIVYMGRPVMKRTPTVSAEQQPEIIPVTTEIVATTTEPAPTPSEPGSYTLADVQAHNTETDCWSAISGTVYDLTSWVSRHPGGAERIIRLCGTDGTAAFTKKHDGAERPTAMLVLLKIGSLK